MRRAVDTVRNEPETASIRTLNLVVLAGEIRKLASAMHQETQSELSDDLSRWAVKLEATAEAHVSDSPCRRTGHRRHPRQARRHCASGRADRLPHGFLVPAAAGAQAAVDRLPRRGAAARRELLRPARLRGAADQPVRHRQGRHPDQSLVPARPADRRDRLQRRADVVVGLDVRVSDAAAGHEGAAWRHPQPDQQPDHPAADAVRPLEAHSVGHFGSGLQRPRPRDDLPVHEFRRAGPRPQARAGAATP